MKGCVIISGQDQNVYVFPGTYKEFQPYDMDGRAEKYIHPLFDENEEKGHCSELTGT